MVRHYLACDLGAESGRVMIGSIEENKLELREIHRFQNVPVRRGESLCWNIPSIWIELKAGLRKAAETGLAFESISTDSWGVDYVLFGRDEKMMEPVFHYRDGRTREGVEKAKRLMEWPEIFAATGIQFMPINTLYQLAAESSERLASASLLLGVGDAINYFLSGVARIDASMASTFQLYDPVQRNWSETILWNFSFPREIFPEIVLPGTKLGLLRAEVARETGLKQMPVLATCSHDTGAAVAGVPGEGSDWAYLSSGTWSLMGVEVLEPVINERSLALNFTNEVGYGHSIRLLKNLSGLWLVQECRRKWLEQGRNFDYAALTKLAADAQPFRSLINAASDEFLAPESMPAQIESFCRRTGQPTPRTEGEFVRCALESLALLYKRTLGQIQELTGRTIRQLHIVGGGSNNDLLNQFAADALQIPVCAGPVEATAAGNIVIQALALGQIASLEAARELIRGSFAVQRFDPIKGAGWAEASRRFETILQSNGTKAGV